MTALVTNPVSPAEVVYPSSDGEPVAETYDHFYVMMTTLVALTHYLQGQAATVLSNQFLYYSQGFPRLRVAPDVMVILDVEPGGRDNYKIWVEGQVPAVIFEMTSKGMEEQDRSFKKGLYEQLGVQEYWLFDPKGEWIPEQLQGYRLQGETYQPSQDSISQVLGLRLAIEGKIIGFYRQDTGEKLLVPDELLQALQASTQARQEIEAQLEQERQRTEQERQRAEKLAEHLRSLGVDPDSLG